MEKESKPQVEQNTQPIQKEVPTSENTKNQLVENMFSALFLIGVGILLLLNTTNLVEWNIWNYLWRFWPIFLIIWGLQIVFRHSFYANLVVNILGFFAMIFVVLLALVAIDSNLLHRLNFNAPTWMNDISNNILKTPGEEKRMEIVVNANEFQNISTRKIVIETGASNFSIKDDNTEDYLKLNAKYFENYGEPKIEKKNSDSDLELNFKPEYKDVFNFSTSDSPQYDFVLGKSNLTTNINVNMGVGNGNVDLTDIIINKLVAEVGAGNLDLNFKDKATPQELDLKVGAGKMTLQIPEEIGYKINYNVGLGNVKSKGKDIGKVGDNKSYESENYANSSKKIEINIDVGIGSFEIK